MTPEEFEAARSALVVARRQACLIDPPAAAWLPRDIDEAWRLQTAVADELGAVVGWKVSAITPAQQRTAGVDAPIAGPLLDHWLIDASSGAAPASLRLADFIAPQIECEFAFQLGRTLAPPAAAAYSRSEVADAVASMRIGIEVVDPRLPRGHGMLIDIADGLNNGAYIAGTATADWASIDLTGCAISLVFTPAGAGSSSVELATGNGAAILGGDPFAAVVMLADTLHGLGRSLQSGDIVTTGSCTGAPRLPGPGSCRADFGRLGAIEVEFE